MSKELVRDYVTIETHFGVPGHFINADTRNKCSEDMVAMLREIAQILYPDDGFDVYLLPPQPGSYRDIIKFVARNKVGSTIGVVLTVSTVTLQYLNYKDSHEAHKTNEEIKALDTNLKCLELKKTLEEVQSKFEVSVLPDAKIAEVCGDLSIKKRKNSFYKNLRNDSMVSTNETILKTSENQCVFSKEIQRSDFKEYIEPIIDNKYTNEDNKGIVELISPVVKQKKEGKGIPWRGVYYGENITYGDVKILTDGEEIEFYMQDPDFKKQISTKERVFAVKDNMEILFDIKGEIKGDSFQNRSIYIKEVSSYNDDIVEHKERVARNKEIAKLGQDNSLFDTLDDETPI